MKNYEKIGLLDLPSKVRQFAEENAGSPCILCHAPRDVVGVYCPDESDRQGMHLPPKLPAIMIYPTCVKCITTRKKELARIVEDKALAPAASSNQA